MRDRIGSMLHALGKPGLPSAILAKPRKSSKEEWSGRQREKVAGTGGTLCGRV